MRTYAVSDLGKAAVDALTPIVDGNNLLVEYGKACRDELTYGCDFATLSADPRIGAKIRFHSPRTAAAEWDGAMGRIAAGFAVISTAPDNRSKSWTPSLVNLYTDDAVWVLWRTGEEWDSRGYPHRMGRPLMEPLIWGATSDKPFGRSRI